MNRMQKWIQRILWGLIIILGLYILYRGLFVLGKSEWVQRKLEGAAINTYITGFGYDGQESSDNSTWLDRVLAEVLPVITYASKEIELLPDSNSSYEQELLVNETEGVETEPQTTAEETESAVQEEETKVAENQEETKAAEDIDIEQLRDFDYLVSNFYVTDPSTTAESSELNVDNFLAKDLQVAENVDGPQILIYHTHSQEAFVDSVEGDSSTTIVGVGERLAEILREEYGFNVLHHTAVYDMIDGNLDRNKAYNLALPDIEQILEENPTIEVVIDLHRDGVEKHYVTEINGKQTAKIMFFNGLSRTARNGVIDYLPNPYIQDNLAFSFQLSLKASSQYPDFVRCIYLQSLRYNLHLAPKALLIESGTHLNTLEEQLNAMEPLADILNQVLRGE